MCIFCDIVAGKAESSIVYRDDLVTAFLDIQPITPGHTLIVPNTHATNLAELPPETGAQLFRVAQRIAAALRMSGLRCEGITLSLADGAAAGQDVFHTHLHVIPRFRDDGFGLCLPASYPHRPPRHTLDKIALKIHSCIIDSSTTEENDDQD